MNACAAHHLGLDRQACPAGFAPLALDWGLTLVQLIGSPMTNTSVNPVRSTGVAVFVGNWVLTQWGGIWVAPTVAP